MYLPLSGILAEIYSSTSNNNFYRSTGDVVSLVYNSVEYQDTSKGTHINSGLGTSTVTGELVSGYTKITIQSGSLPVTQYIISKSGDPTLYLGTYITGEVDPGELRWIARLKKSA